MKLYMHPVSTTSRPVEMLAKMIGVPLELSVVDLVTGEHHSPAYVKINPNRLVPVLDDEGFLLTESSAIMKYIADKSGTPLYPKDVQKRARVNERMDWFNTNFYREIGYHLVYPQVYPHHARQTEEITKATAEWGKQKVAPAFEVLDTWVLGNNPFTCGADMTIADIFGAQLVSCGELVGVDLSPYPNVSRWMTKMKALPEWSAVNAIHDAFAASLKEKPFVA